MVRVNKHLIVAKQLTKRDYHQYEDKGNEQITRNMIFGVGKIKNIFENFII